MKNLNAYKVKLQMIPLCVFCYRNRIESAFKSKTQKPCWLGRILLTNWYGNTQIDSYIKHDMKIMQHSTTYPSTICIKRIPLNIESAAIFFF
ncbi:hypothetical protein OIU84_012303 [Salix udensis]|uniref:Uncharacterized protein n=1 Tax=Salix udensis TaxID=889485 RepID=A0AAD6NTI5_9ROSI|nr:hypothetical protein OIU84_012303 [Salix udensis]